MNKTTRDTLVIGFAMFAIFFGAGNLIFPPAIGLQSGPAWPIAILGLIVTGIVLPILSVIGVSNGGGRFLDLSKHVGMWFHNAFNLFVMIGVGTLMTIPRTGATAHETGVAPLFPGVPIWITVIIYFALVYYFANDKSQVIDKVGKFLTPGLLIILAVIIIKAIVTPAGTPVETGLANPFTNAFLYGYNIGDLLTGLLCAGIFINGVLAAGYTETAARKKITLNAAILGGALLVFVYGGLLYMGATVNGIFPKDIENTALLVGGVEKLMGRVGVGALGIAVILATLTTAIGLSASVADFLSSFTKNKLSYRNAILIVCIVGVVQALGGVQKIITLAYPMFLTAYPVSIVLTFMGLFYKYIPNDGAYKGAAIFCPN
jgi:LIVCS family branched-chain amino acid:cation transporter